MFSRWVHKYLVIFLMFLEYIWLVGKIYWVFTGKIKVGWCFQARYIGIWSFLSCFWNIFGWLMKFIGSLQVG